MSLSDLTGVSAATMSDMGSEQDYDRVYFNGNKTTVKFVFLEPNIVGHDFLKQSTIIVPNSANSTDGFHLEQVLVNRPLKETPADMVGKPNKNNPEIKLNKFWWDKSVDCLLSDAHDFAGKNKGENLARRAVYWNTPILMLTKEAPDKEGKMVIEEINAEKLKAFAVNDYFFETGGGCLNTLIRLLQNPNKAGKTKLETDVFSITGKKELVALDKLEEFLSDEQIELVNQKREEYAKRKADLLAVGQFNSTVALNPDHQKLYPKSYDKWLEETGGHLYSKDDFNVSGGTATKPNTSAGKPLSKKTDLLSKPTEQEIAEVGQLD